MFLLHFSRFKTFLFFGHSKVKVRSCVLCVYAGTPLPMSCDNWFYEDLSCDIRVCIPKKNLCQGAHSRIITLNALAKINLKMLSS